MYVGGGVGADISFVVDEGRQEGRKQKSNSGALFSLELTVAYVILFLQE